MSFKTPKGRPRSEALQHLSNLATVQTDECQWPLTDQKRVIWTDGSRSPSWISCAITHGLPPEGKVPVQNCGVLGCVNGRHWRWGTMQEALENRRFKDRRGGENPNAKLNWDKVSALRAIKWKGGNHKATVAEQYRISLRTLNSVLKGWAWKETERPELEPKGDEF